MCGMSSPMIETVYVTLVFRGEGLESNKNKMYRRALLPVPSSEVEDVMRMIEHSLLDLEGQEEEWISEFDWEAIEAVVIERDRKEAGDGLTFVAKGWM